MRYALCALPYIAFIIRRPLCHGTRMYALKIDRMPTKVAESFDKFPAKRWINLSYSCLLISSLCGIFSHECPSCGAMKSSAIILVLACLASSVSAASKEDPCGKWGGGVCRYGETYVCIDGDEKPEGSYLHFLPSIRWFPRNFVAFNILFCSSWFTQDDECPHLKSLLTKTHLSGCGAERISRPGLMLGVIRESTKIVKRSPQTRTHSSLRLGGGHWRAGVHVKRGIAASAVHFEQCCDAWSSEIVSLVTADVVFIRGGYDFDFSPGSICALLCDAYIIQCF